MACVRAVLRVVILEGHSRSAQHRVLGPERRLIRRNLLIAEAADDVNDAEAELAREWVRVVGESRSHQLILHV